MRSLIRSVRHGAQYGRRLLTDLDLKETAWTREQAPLATHAILLVPGFLGTRSVMRPMQTRFRMHEVVAFTLNSGLFSVRSLRTITDILVARIVRIRTSFPRIRRLDIVGHSLGGLVALDAIKDGVLDGMEDPRLVGLGTPYQGTWTGALGCWFSPAAYQLMPVHARYREPHLARVMPPDRFLSVGGTEDWIVPLPRTRHPDAIPERAETDHAGLVLDKKVYRRVRDFLLA